jgi:hypothetical protein
MYATAKDMFFPFFANEAKEAAKPVAKTEGAVKTERAALIDKMVETWGIDREVRRRYFEVSAIV